MDSAHYDFDEVVGALQHVFGIVGICPMQIQDVIPYEELQEKVVQFFGEEYPEQARKGLTFKVHCRRLAKNYPMDSQEINAALGEALLGAYPETAVDVHEPKVMVHVEIRERIYLYTHTIPGAGGLPVGSSGKAMLLLSGGIDSPVAGYMMAKRGVHIAAIHYVSPPYTSDRAQLKVEQLCEKLTDYCGGIAFYCVPFTELQEAIKDHCPEEFFTIIMRRLMMEIAQRIAEKDNCLALITGESVGQVASQTMAAIACTDAVCRIPVFRPCVGMDKTEIIEIARKIDTFETSTLPYEDCCTVFTPRHPKVRPQLADIEKAQNSFDFEPLIQKAVEGTTMKTFNYSK